ncbi:MAG: MBL fold metallo-hydrolase [Deltaproteobacteria bacterium]|nr:MBL fold metallo-hydrolase [Deltaproteobacteria bacterium]
MLIKCWGTRGSIPVSGPEYLKYGGDTTCIEIRTKNDEIIIVDAGSSIRRAGNKFIAEGRSDFTMLFTHAHWDHLMGFPFFKPLYSSKSRIKICGCPFAQSTVEEMISRIMTPPYFPVNFDNIRAEITYEGECYESFLVDSVTITPIFLNHPNQGLGYKFVEDGKSFVFITDNELGFKHPGGLDFDDYRDFATNADIFIHDSEYTEGDYKRTRGWGHTVYNDALRLAMEANVKNFGLFHHNQDRNDDGVDQIVRDCHTMIEKHRSPLECFAVYQNMELIL